MALARRARSVPPTAERFCSLRGEIQTSDAAGTCSAFQSGMRSRWISALVAVSGLAVWIEACSSAGAVTPNGPSPSIPPPPGVVSHAIDSLLWMEMRNVDLRIDNKSAMRIRALQGQVVPTTAGTIAVLDDPSSFKIRATSGTVALDGEAITTLLNTIAFNYPGAPIKNLRVRIEDGQVVQRGVLHTGGDSAFEMWSVPELLPDGRLRLHPNKLTIFGVNGLTLMHALGLKLEKMMDLSGSRGASVSGDDILLDPLAIIPPPTVAGKLKSVRVEGNYLVQQFVQTRDDTVFGTFVVADSGSKNFIYFRGGTLRFGKLTMVDTDLLNHDANESDPFDVYFKEYNRQLVAGHSKNLLNFGLRTWMVDYHRLGDSTRTVARK